MFTVYCLSDAASYRYFMVFPVFDILYGAELIDIHEHRNREDAVVSGAHSPVFLLDLQEKYQVAAQNTLNACYRECLQLLAESELKTVAIPCFWYSRLEGNHFKFEGVHPPEI